MEDCRQQKTPQLHEVSDWPVSLSLPCCFFCLRSFIVYSVVKSQRCIGSQELFVRVTKQQHEIMSMHKGDSIYVLYIVEWINAAVVNEGDDGR